MSFVLDPWGDAPGCDDEGRWPTKLQNSRFGLGFNQQAVTLRVVMGGLGRL
ncbi:hypothetical protein RISK_004395 [Rhodopirellula islandica]|uniref:Uncharacterized protein n=1 Tax=Rhodopirellula islandica TaxID=595434 RepID=A0A0J1EDH9_RHOIS|nr:hypothetical protein RISK_004395 [Rhodopirellula islandica]